MTTAKNVGMRMRMSSVTRFISFFFIIPLLLTGCSLFEPEEGSNASRQQQLLAQLESNRLKWAQSGVTDYSFEVHKDCDCPDELKTQHRVMVAGDSIEEQEEDLIEDLALLDKPRAKGKISARDDEDRRRRQSTSVENVFSDLRQAILLNAVQQVDYDDDLGFPQNVLLNTAAFGQPVPINPVFVGNNIQLDDDDDRPFSQLQIQTRNFQVLNSSLPQNNLAFNGQFIRQPSDDGFNEQFWLVDNDGRWNQLNVPPTFLPNINNLPNQSFIQGNGQWIPGGVNGLGQINLQQFTPGSVNPFQNSLNGTLFYNVQNNDTFDLDDFFVDSDDGRRVFLNVPTNLQNRAFNLAGQRVRLNGNWTNGSNSRFNPTQFDTFNNDIQRFTGILQGGNSLGVPGSNPSSFRLIDDYGSAIELQIPANILASTPYLYGQRVEVFGTQLFAGIYGQPIIVVQQINPVQNIFTDTQIVGTVISTSPFSNAAYQEVLIQMETGATITVRLPSFMIDQFNPPAYGMTVQVSGAWIGNPAFGQGVFEARTPMQIINFGYNTANTYNGYISNVGSFGSTACTGTQTTYNFTSDTGQMFQLFINSSTPVSGLYDLVNLPYQSRVQVTGIEVSPGILQAQDIIVLPQAQTMITGTIIDIGAAGAAYTCLGTQYTYRLLDQFGNAYSITTTPNSIVQGSLGSGVLRIGDVVQVTGALTGASNSFYASRVDLLSAPSAGIPVPFPQPVPVPPPIYQNASTLMGTVTGLDCAIGNTETFIFIDQSGQLYRLRVDQNIAGGSFWIDVGTQLQVTGAITNGNEIIARSVNQVATFADPVNRIPISGTVSGPINSITTCNSPVYVYQFQSDTGQVYQLRLTNEAAQHQNAPLPSGSRITVTARIDTYNPQYMDALEIQYGGFGNFSGSTGGFSSTFMGSVVANLCGSEYYFVEQSSGIGYTLIMNQQQGLITPSFGTPVSVSGEMVGNTIYANSVFPTASYPTVLPPPSPQTGRIVSSPRFETSSCGAAITIYGFQNDNGLIQELYVFNNGFTSQLVSGSRVRVTPTLSSFDGIRVYAQNVTTAFF